MAVGQRSQMEKILKIYFELHLSPVCLVVAAAAVKAIIGYLP
jgi:hypothetical protein